MKSCKDIERSKGFVIVVVKQRESMWSGSTRQKQRICIIVNFCLDKRTIRLFPFLQNDSEKNVGTIRVGLFGEEKIKFDYERIGASENCRLCCAGIRLESLCYFFGVTLCQHGCSKKLSWTTSISVVFCILDIQSAFKK